MANVLDGDLKKEIASQRKALQRLAATDLSPEEVRAAKGDEQLTQMRAASATITAARAELSRRQVERHDRPWKNAKMDAWAHSPTSTRSRRRRGPDPYEPVKKVFWLLRNSLPFPLEQEHMDGGRLSAEEGQELHELTLRNFKGGLPEDEQARWEHLLEKAADLPGAIQSARDHGFPKPVPTNQPEFPDPRVFQGGF